VIKNAAPQRERDGSSHVQLERNRLTLEIAEPAWRGAPLSTSPRGQLWIGNQLIVLAVAGLVAHLISLISR
jgi:hypothetical protein